MEGKAETVTKELKAKDSFEDLVADHNKHFELYLKPLIRFLF